MIRSLPNCLFLFITFIFLLGTSHSNAQTPILISGTDFTPATITTGSNFYDLSNVVQYGVNPGTLTTNIPYIGQTPSAFLTSNRYVVTDNPANVSSTEFFTQPNDYKFLFSNVNNPPNTGFLNYRLNGLIPNSKVKVVINIVKISDHFNSPTCTGNSSVVEAAFNLNIPGASTNKYIEYDAISKDDTLEANTDRAGQCNIQLRSPYIGLCFALGITKLQVFGSPKIRIANPNVSVFCVGDTVTIRSDFRYYGNYIWQKLQDNAWIDVATSRDLKYTFNKEESASLRFTLANSENGNLFYSDTVVISSKLCCTNQSSNQPVPYTTIFHDNFGRLDLADSSGQTYFIHTYRTSSITPQEVKQTTTTPFRWKTIPEPIESIFAQSGVLLDGNYAVASYLTNAAPYEGFSGAMLQWAGNIHGKDPQDPISYDHSGTKDGGVLLINMPFNSFGKSVYTRSFENLCTATGTVFFECYISVFTISQTASDIIVRLTSGQSTLDLPAIAYGSGSNNGIPGRWVRIFGEIQTVNNSLKAEVINNVRNENLTMGGDLALDDIRIYTCNSPCATITGSNTPDATTHSLVYPNPSTDQITINNHNSSYTIYNSQGTKIFEGIDLNLSISSWTSGIYYLVLQDLDGNKRMQKFVKQ